MKGKDFLGGILLGAIIGAAIGLLLAPQSGEETRDTITDQAREISDRVKEGSRQFLESSRDLLEQSKTQVTSAVQQGREQVGTAASALTNAVKDKLKES